MSVALQVPDKILQHFFTYEEISAVAQLVEHPSKAPGRSNSTDMGSNPGLGIKWEENPSHAI